MAQRRSGRQEPWAPSSNKNGDGGEAEHGGSEGSAGGQGRAAGHRPQGSHEGATLERRGHGRCAYIPQSGRACPVVFPAAPRPPFASVPAIPAPGTCPHHHPSHCIPTLYRTVKSPFGSCAFRILFFTNLYFWFVF